MTIMDGIKQAKGRGSLNPERHEQRDDVKAVTSHRFSLEKTDQGWPANVTLAVCSGPFT